jgi:hypothetical protein
LVSLRDNPGKTAAVLTPELSRVCAAVDRCVEKVEFIKFVMAITFRLWERPYQCGMRVEAAMRKALFLAVLGTLLLAAAVEVVAAGVKTSALRSHFYAAAPASAVAIAVPASMKSFPTELLPQ